MKDVLLDENSDLKIVNGDLVIGVSDDQHKNLLLLCNKGDFKEHPDACVGIENYLEDEDPAALLREIKAQYSADGMNVSSIKIMEGKIHIDAAYNG